MVDAKEGVSDREIGTFEENMTPLTQANVSLAQIMAPVAHDASDAGKCVSGTDNGTCGP